MRIVFFASNIYHTGVLNDSGGSRPPKKVLELYWYYAGYLFVFNIAYYFDKFSLLSLSHIIF